MRAAVLTSLNAPLEIHDIEPAGPLTFGQVRVRVLSAGICGAQLQEIRGEKGGPLPHLMGHEGCGIVEETGPGVTRVKPGDKVVMHWRKAAGIESDFPKYRFTRPQHTEVQMARCSDDPTIRPSDHPTIRSSAFTSGLVTTWAEQTICSENRLTPVPPDTPRELAALLGCGLSTALATIEHEADLKFGERVMVVGVGGLGVNLIAAAKLAQASAIYATDIHETKRKTAEYMGCTFFSPGQNKNTAVCDCIIDTVGSGGSVAAAFSHLAPSGRYILVGQPRPGEALTLPNARQLFSGEGQSIRATQGGGFKPHEDIPRYIALWRTGRLKLEGIVSHRYGLHQINEALDQVRAGEASRVMIDFNPLAETRNSDPAEKLAA